MANIISFKQTQEVILTYFPQITTAISPNFLSSDHMYD
jgi:hypothetical protein